MTTALIPHVPDDVIAAETCPIGEAAWRRATLDAALAPLLALLRPCPTCGTVAGPCVTAGGRVARERHVGRLG